ncbi:DinB family protein [Flavitalea flava]
MPSLRKISKPKEDEYPAYSSIYMDLVEDDGLVLAHLQENFLMIRNLVYSLPEEKLIYRYAPGKWTIKEILVHLIDDERIFVYRALRFARNDKTKLPGFDQDAFAAYSLADDRSLDSIFEEYVAVRNSTIAFFNGLPQESLMRRGIADGQLNERTVRAIVYHIAGHELRHLKIIKERYLG